jgi:hypothetical protein
VNLASDFEEMLSALSAESVEFMLVGGYAVILHTEPRYTKDLDIWVRPTLPNAKRVMRALKRFGAPLFRVRLRELAEPGLILQLGVEPIRIDIITEVEGVAFEKAWPRRVLLPIGGMQVPVLSIADLIRNKRSVARPMDLVDVGNLEAAARERPRSARAVPKPKRQPRPPRRGKT